MFLQLSPKKGFPSLDMSYLGNSICKKNWDGLTLFTDIFEQLFNFFIRQIVSKLAHDVTKIVWIDKSILVSIESNKRVFQFYREYKSKLK